MERAAPNDILETKLYRPIIRLVRAALDLSLKDLICRTPNILIYAYSYNNLYNPLAIRYTIVFFLYSTGLLLECLLTLELDTILIDK